MRSTATARASRAGIRRRMAPPLPAASRPSKATTSETSSSARPAMEPVQAALQVGELGAVVVLVDLGGRIRGDRTAGAVAGRFARGLRDGRKLARQPGLQRLQQEPSHHQVSPARLLTVDHVPGGGSRVRRLQDLLGRGGEAVVQLEVAPVALGHAPARERIGLELAQTLLLCLAAHVQPQLEDDAAVGRQHVLEAAVLLQPCLEAAILDLAHPQEQRRQVPGRQQQVDAPRAAETRASSATSAGARTPRPRARGSRGSG